MPIRLCPNLCPNLRLSHPARATPLPHLPNLPRLPRLSRLSRLAGLIGLLAGLLAPPLAQAQPLPGALRVLVLDLEQAGDLGDATMQAERTLRLQRLSQRLRQRLGQAGLVTVVDDTPQRERLAYERALHDLRHCNGCELDIARALAADAVLVGWLFRMSQLILTMHFELRDAATGQLLMKRALDFRNDAENSGERMLDYLLRDMREGRLWNGAPTWVPGQPPAAAAAAAPR